ncbi:MAG: lipid-binding SYLF domain-containing protein [Pseudomonadota bacterium]
MNQARLFVVIAAVALATAAQAENALDIRIDNAALSWDGVVTGIGGSLPERLRSDARAVIVVPQLIKAGFGFGGSFGRGVLLRRAANGQWQPPVFVTVSGGSFGWQAGLSSMELLLVFRSEQAVAALLNRGLTLGADAGVAAGPFGRRASASSDFQADAAVVSYAVAGGLFAGVSVEGLLVRVESRNTQRYYRNAGFAPPYDQPLKLSQLPQSAQRFLAKIASDVSPIASTDTPDEGAADDDDSLVTFGLGQQPLDDDN